MDIKKLIKEKNGFLEADLLFDIPVIKSTNPDLIKKAFIKFTGLVSYEIPRKSLPKAREILRGKKSGIYLLTDNKLVFGPGDGYSGKGDIWSRLKKHDKEKSFWNRAIVIIPENDCMSENELHVLEYWVIQAIKKKKLLTLKNKNDGYIKELSEGDLFNLYRICNTMHTLLDDFGIDLKGSITPKHEQKTELYFLNGKKATAQGFFHKNGFVVKKGSIVSGIEVKSLKNRARKLRRKLQDDEVLKKDKRKQLIFATDYEFNNASIAASVVLGNSRSGKEWRRSTIKL
jgi:Domain of unknown function (DUF4357)